MAVPVGDASSGTAATEPGRQNRHEPIRIVIVNEVWDPRDRSPDDVLERFTTLTGWARALAGAGGDVRVFQRFDCDGSIVRDGIRYDFVSDDGPARPPTRFGGSSRMRTLIASAAPDVVHVNGMDYPRSLRRIRALLGRDAALVVQDHGGFDPRAVSPFRRVWLRHGLAAADALLVSTAPQAREFRASGIVPERVRLHDAMESSTAMQVGPRPQHDGTWRILWVGRLNANKAPLTTLDGFAGFVHSGRSARLTFVYGSAELEDPLRDAVRRHRLESLVTLAGAVAPEALPQFYANADLFVLGSRREGSGYAALEAMACGVVPVLTDIPAFRGLTDDGRIGTLWQAGDSAALTQALARVAALPLEPQRQAARDRFERCFSWPAIGQRAMAVYREVSAR